MRPDSGRLGPTSIDLRHASKTSLRNALVRLRGHELLADAAAAYQLTRHLPRHLRRPIQPWRCQSIVQERLQRREASFASVARELIFQQPTSPYLTLLRATGCEAGDLDRLVATEGVEGALRALQEQGVYLQIDELKGRREVVRGSLRFRIGPGTLNNPGVRRDLGAATSGSSGSRVLVPLDLDSIRDQSVDMAAALAARGGMGWSLAIWGVPGGASFDQILSSSAFGLRPARWFSQVHPAASGLHQRYRWSARWLSAVAALAGRPLPRPRFVPVERPEPILEWLADERRRGRTPCLRTFASSAVRLCRVAREAGQSLEGVQIWMGGEPVTAARVATVQASGATVFPSYGVMEAGPLATGCQAPAAPDDLHLFTDRLAVVQPGAGRGEAGLPADALLLTTLLPSARIVLFNAALGDRASVEQRTCGCPLEAIGWTTHLSSVRGYQKTTAAGMTFLDSDIVRVLDEELPGQFGGGPGDYQLVEEEDSVGQAQLTLLVDPGIGAIDSDQVREAFLHGLGVGSGAERVMELAWRAEGLLRVERQVPRAGLTGKILHLRQERRREPVAGAGR